jgi:hypothetical protein
VPWQNVGIGLTMALGAGSLLAAWLWHWRRGAVTLAVLAAALAADVGQFGWLEYWRYMCPKRETAGFKPDQVAWQKELIDSGLRVSMCNQLVPADQAPALAAPNVCTLAGVKNVYGYTPLTLIRFLEVLWEGYPIGASVEMLGIRYMVANGVTEQGIAWQVGLVVEKPFGPPGPNTLTEASLPAADFPATDIALVSTMGGSVGLPDSTPVAELTAVTPDGREITAVVRAGDHTAEHAIDRPDVKGIVRHRKPAVFSDAVTPLPGGGTFPAHDFLAVLSLPERVTVRELRVRRLATAGDSLLSVNRITLFDRRPDGMRFLPLRSKDWRPTEWCDGRYCVYQYQRPLRRAWLASEALCLPGVYMPNSIRSRTLPDGRTFDPYRTALVESAVTLSAGPPDPNAEAVVTRDRSTVVEVRTRSNRDGMLVLAELNYPGWRATLDGQRTQVYTTDYLLRGVPVPAGEHVVRFDFHPHSFSQGLTVAGVSLATLLGMLAFSRWRARAKPLAA